MWAVRRWTRFQSVKRRRERSTTEDTSTWSLLPAPRDRAPTASPCVRLVLRPLLSRRSKRLSSRSFERIVFVGVILFHVILFPNGESRSVVCTFLPLITDFYHRNRVAVQSLRRTGKNGIGLSFRRGNARHLRKLRGCMIILAKVPRSRKNGGHSSRVHFFPSVFVREWQHICSVLIRSEIAQSR